MGHCPQSYRHGGHCLGRCIRYNLLHALMRTITLIIIQLILNLERTLFIRHQNGCLTKNCY